jgi:Esterase FrsA-like
VHEAVEHWAPRFTTNGVAVADLASITEGIEVWADWCSAWCRVGQVHEDLGRTALAEGRNRSAGTHLSQAAVYYHFAKFVFVHDLDQMYAAHARAVSCLTDALAHLDPPGERVHVELEGSSLVGVLRRPRAPARPPHPVVVLVPGLDSAKEEFGSTEALFLERGLATFSVTDQVRARPSATWPFAGTGRFPAGPSSTGCPRSPTSTPAGSAHGASAWAATTRHDGPAATSGSARASLWPDRTTSASASPPPRS